MATAVAAVIPLITATAVFSCRGFNGNLLIATFPTTAEVAIPMASSSKVSWKSFSEAWPRAQPSSSSKDSPSNEFPALHPFCFLHWTLTDTAKEYMGDWLYTERFFFMSALMLFFHRHKKGPSKMSPFPSVSPERPPQAPFFSFVSHRWYLLLCGGQLTITWDIYLPCTQQEHSPSVVAVMSTFITARQAQGPWTKSAPDGSSTTSLSSPWP